MTMDERKQRIMQAIVTLYALEGEPVGSGLLASYFDMAVSSATLRNEMAAMTKLGLLEQPHTSAGRVPSAKGYRYYLDNLLNAGASPDAATRERIREGFAGLDQDSEKLAQAAAKMIAKMTGYTTVIAMPRSDDLCIAHYEVVQVGRYAAAVLAVTSAGGVRTRVAHVGCGLTRADAQALAVLLNQNLTFVAPADLSQPLLTALCAEAGSELVPVIAAAAGILSDSAKPHVYLGGEQDLLQWPEMNEYLPALLAALNDDERAFEMMRAPSNRTTVLLGEDFDPPMPGLCVMTKNYLVGGGLAGSIALVGPARMPFSQLIPVLEACAAELGSCMAGRAEAEPDES